MGEIPHFRVVILISTFFFNIVEFYYKNQSNILREMFYGSKSFIRVTCCFSKNRVSEGGLQARACERLQYTAIYNVRRFVDS